MNSVTRLALFLIIFPGTGSAQSVDVDCQTFCAAFGNPNVTQIKKNELFALMKDKEVTWTGTLTDVRQGLLGGISLQMKCRPETIVSDVLVDGFSADQKKDLLQLQNGQKVTVTGTLVSWGELLPHYIRKARLVPTPPVKQTARKRK